MKYCIVTGGAGFIGSHLVDKLIDLGRKVIVVDNLSTGTEENINPKAEFHERDVCNYFAEEEIDVIFHLAAMARIQPSFNYPQEVYEANSFNTVAALELARLCNAKLVFAGSSSVGHRIFANPYTYTKWVGEMHCLMYSEIYKVPTVIGRFFNVIGPRQIEEGDYATLMGIFERQTRNKEPLTITGDGTQRRDFCHVSDIVDGLIKMSEGEWYGEVFNLGTGRNYSINEVAAMFGGPVKYLPKRRGEAETTLADLSFTKEKLGWEAKIRLEEYVANLLNTGNETKN